MDIDKIGLPKWPAMTVRGESVTPEQALEVIRRTDSFWKFASTNHKEVDAEIKDILKYPNFDNLATDFNFEEHMRIYDKWNSVMGVLDLEYINNSWVGTSFIGGPNGWMNPDGTIEKLSGNIGKWPEASEVLDEWQKVAEAFDFLDLEVVLFDGESCESNISPVFKITVKDGKAVASEVDDIIVEGHSPVDNSNDMLSIFLGSLQGKPTKNGKFTREHYWSPREIQGMWGHLVKDL